MTSPPKPKAKSPDDELRCDCGRLVARYVAGGVEIRCGRCKRPLVIRVEGSITAVIVGED